MPPRRGKRKAAAPLDRDDETVAAPPDVVIDQSVPAVSQSQDVVLPVSSSPPPAVVHVPADPSAANSIPAAEPGQIDVVFSFDTTGSMSTCVEMVRKYVKELVERLFTELKNIRIGLICHNDYDHGSMLYTHIDLTDSASDLVAFVNKGAGKSYGGISWSEAYEYVLREAQKLSWRPGAARALVMIGDATPHEPSDYQNKEKIDWRKECDALKALKIPVYSVQCLWDGASDSLLFWSQLAKRTDGYHLFLDQFSFVRDMIIAICLQQASEDAVLGFEQELKNRAGGVLTHSARRLFDSLLKRVSDLSAVNASDYDLDGNGDDLKPCPPSKYQILDVDKQMSIKAFVQENGLQFKTGRGFYQFTKPEQISAKKQIVLQKKTTGELFEGNSARRIAGITSANATHKVAPSDIPDYYAFVQSTSYNRNLVAGSLFLYEADDFGTR